VRGVIEQVAKGLQAFHRLEMLHQDLRPDNIMIDHAGTVKIIDFGSTRVSGIADDPPFGGPEEILGTLQYTAPEYFTGNAASTASDIFSLGVIAYQMLTGRLPYGADVAKVRSKSHLRKLRYRPAVDDHREIPGWVDKTLRTAVHPDPGRRYAELSEFMFDLSHPGKNAETAPVSLMDRNPVLFWQCVSAILAIVVLCLLLALR
jgi:serine/threonine protein kinase